VTDALYLHIPFCAHLCAYCDFCKVLFDEKWAFSYVQELKKEMASYPIGKVSTLYIGGGTPTSLPDDLFAEVLALAAPHLRKGGEFTVEANPENLSEENLRCLRHYGVNRLSLGVESASPRLLEMMGRHHTFAEAKEAVARAKKAGFRNLSCDLIYALPRETLAELNEDLRALLSLQVPHLSTYCLSVNPGTRFAKDGKKEMGQNRAGGQYEQILQTLRAAGYDRYEVSNFALKGFESRHNLVYWHDEEYYGAGLGASGYVNGVRYENTRNLQKYLGHDWVASRETVGGPSALEYYFLTNLRLEKGFSLASFQRKFGFSFFSRYSEVFERLRGQGLLGKGRGRVACSDKGIMLLDRVLLALY
jgi:oxygen-independent coproporphyrinogen-3 oxidase